MTARSLVALALISPLALAGCVTTTTSATEMGPPYPEQEWSRPGQIQSMREVVRRQQGNPAGGAVAGAIIGSMIGGRGASAVAGAIGGAVVGAAVSQGQGNVEQRWYEVQVRFDDGSWETYSYEVPPPFRPGDRVALTPRGIEQY